jgi:hypothetical protein
MAEEAAIDLAEAEELLTALADVGIGFVVVGSLARLWLGVSADLPRDVDILLEDAGDSLDRLVLTLRELGFAAESWGEPVGLPLDRAVLSGRFYLRFRRERQGKTLIADATYESPLLSFREAWGRRVQRGAFALASPEDEKRFRW